MEENSKAVTTEDVGTKTPFSAKVKEWFRKKIVNLKRKPSNIPLLFYAVTSVFYIIVLTSFSEEIYTDKDASGMAWTGLLIFINVLLSLLILVSFLNSFPKRKKPNVFFIVLVAVMTIAMILCSVFYYKIVNDYIADKAVVIKYLEDGITVDYTYIDDSVIWTLESSFASSLTYSIVHIVLLAVSGVVFAFLPVYSKFIRKINTRVELESATENISSGAIDIQED